MVPDAEREALRAGARAVLARGWREGRLWHWATLTSATTVSPRARASSPISIATVLRPEFE